jgi:predicted transposase/invertase (TIGR01784 family)
VVSWSGTPHAPRKKVKVRSTLDPTQDLVFKLLFASPDGEGALRSLLKAILGPEHPFERVQVLNPEVLPETVDDKSAVLDLLVRLDGDVHVDLEMQALARPSFRERALFYWSGPYRGQLKKGAPYTSLAKVVSVLLLDYPELEGNRLHSTFHLREKHDGSLLTPVMEMHVVELGKRPPLGVRSIKEDLVAWARFLGAKTDDEVKEACMRDPAIHNANEVLNALSAKAGVREMARRRQESLALYQMELSKAAQDGEARGRAEEARAGICGLAQVLGIDVAGDRRAQLDRLSLDQLIELRQRLIQERCW